MSSWHRYPKVFNLGHKAVVDLLYGPVVVQEKIDGSQFSFCRIPHEKASPQLVVRSKGVVMPIDAPDKMFSKAVETVILLQSQLVPGWTYRAEYLQKPKHNTLAYDRIPDKHLILFDVNTDEEAYLSPKQLQEEATRLGLEAVPVLFEGPGEQLTPEIFQTWLTRDSTLGGQKIEGFVIKNYTRFGSDKKVLMGKHVSEAFKEVHVGEWRAANPTGSDIVQEIIDAHRTPARWQKAVQHLKERGEYEGSPRDIGKLLKEVSNDVRAEEADAIKERLFKHFWKQIQRGIVTGLPEWYKEELMKKQFEPAEAEDEGTPEGLHNIAMGWRGQ